MTGDITTATRSDAPTGCTPYTSEADLELAISAAMQRMCAAPDRTLKMQYWREMCGLIDQRTPGRRRFMERMRGLA